MINEDDIIKKSENKYEIGMFALAWRNSEMRDCKVKIVDERHWACKFEVKDFMDLLCKRNLSNASLL